MIDHDRPLERLFFALGHVVDLSFSELNRAHVRKDFGVAAKLTSHDAVLHHAVGFFAVYAALARVHFAHAFASIVFAPLPTGKDEESDGEIRQYSHEDLRVSVQQVREYRHGKFREQGRLNAPPSL